MSHEHEQTPTERYKTWTNPNGTIQDMCTWTNPNVTIHDICTWTNPTGTIQDICTWTNPQRNDTRYMYMNKPQRNDTRHVYMNKPQRNEGSTSSSSLSPVVLKYVFQLRFNLFVFSLSLSCGIIVHVSTKVQPFLLSLSLLWSYSTCFNQGSTFSSLSPVVL